MTAACRTPEQHLLNQYALNEQAMNVFGFALQRPLSYLPFETPSSSSRLSMYSKNELLVLAFVDVVVVVVVFNKC